MVQTIITLAGIDRMVHQVKEDDTAQRQED
jgi:hypothetical protein